MKFCLLCLLLFPFLAFAVVVKVPVFLDGIYEDPSQAARDHFYSYDVQGSLGPTPVKPQETQNRSVEELTSSLLDALIKNDQKKYLDLYSAAGRQKIKAQGEEAFQYLWQQFKPQRGYRINWYFHHRKGVVVSWSGVENLGATLFYAEKKSTNWQLEYFSADETDVRLQNLLLYLSYAPLDFKEATVLKDFRLSDQELSVALQLELPFVHVFLRGGTEWELFSQLRDNQVERVRHRDREKALGLVKLVFKKDELPKGQSELLFVQSRFPMRSLPFSVIKKGQLQLR